MVIYILTAYMATGAAILAMSKRSESYDDLIESLYAYGEAITAFSLVFINVIMCVFWPVKAACWSFRFFSKINDRIRK